MPGYTLVAAASVGVIGAAGCFTCVYPPQQPEPEPEPEPEPASAGPPEHYAVAIHPPPGPVCYGSGVEVYAQIKAGAGSQGWARAVVTGAVPPSDPTAPAAAAAAAAGTEHTVRVLGGCGPSFNRQRAGSEVVVRAARLHPVGALQLISGKRAVVAGTFFTKINVCKNIISKQAQRHHKNFILHIIT